MTLGKLTDQLTQARQELSLIRRMPPKREPIKRLDDHELRTLPYHITPHTQDLLNYLHDVALADVNRYQPLPKPAEDEGLKEPRLARPAHPEAHTATPEARPTAAATTVIMAVAAPSFPPVSPDDLDLYFHHLHVHPLMNSVRTDAINTILTTMPADEQGLYALFYNEIETASKNIATSGLSIGAMQKAKRVLEIMASGRLQDAITYLRRTRNEEASSRTLSFMLSQALYFLAHHGHKDKLPEARSEANRSCIFGDKVDPYQLLRYRYFYMTAEYALDRKRALELMREFYLISPEVFATTQGVAVHEGINLKSLLLLAALDAKDWGSYELEAIATLANTVMGGALIYIHFFRPKILTRMQLEPENFEAYKSIEQDLAGYWQHHQRTESYLREHFNDQGIAINGPKNLWTVPARFVHIFLTQARIPQADEVLMNISLDAKKFFIDCTTDTLLRKKGLVGINLWYVWSRKLTPYPQIHSDDVLPFDRIVSDAPALVIYHQILQEIIQQEGQYTTSEKWEQALPHLAPLVYQQILEAGAGQAFHPTQRGPELPHMRPYYDMWSTTIEDNPLLSYALGQRAQWGAFWNLEEIQTALDGCELIMADPIWSLGARMRIAFRHHLKDRAALDTTSKQARQEAMRAHFAGLWWFYFLLLPLGLITFVVVSSADNYLSAIRTVLTLAVLLAGFALILYQIVQKKD